MSFNYSNDGITIARLKSDDKNKNNKILYFNSQYDDENNDEYTKNFKEQKLKKGENFHLMPSDLTRSIYISGQQGIGKSYFISQYLKEYQKKHPNSKIIFFSEKEYDKNIDDCIKNIKRVPCDDSLLDNPISKDELNTQEAYTMFVFDDVDALPKKIKSEVYRVLNSLINVYREQKLNIIFSSHESCDGKNTKTALNGSDCIVFFHRNFNRSTEYLIKQYINKNEFKKFSSGDYNKSRWCCYVKSYPSLLLFENFIKVL